MVFGCLSEFTDSIFQGIFEGGYPRQKSSGSGVRCMELGCFTYSVDSIRLFTCRFSWESKFYGDAAGKIRLKNVLAFYLKFLCVWKKTL